MEKSHKKVITVIGLSILIICIILYYFNHDINVKVKVGEGFGTKIGANKEIVFKNCRDFFNRRRLYVDIQYPIYTSTERKRVDWSISDFNFIRERDVWQFSFKKKGYFDMITFQFENSTLSSIYRFRKRYEFMRNE